MGKEMWQEWGQGAHYGIAGLSPAHGWGILLGQGREKCKDRRGFGVLALPEPLLHVCRSTNITLKAGEKADSWFIYFKLLWKRGFWGWFAAEEMLQGRDGFCCFIFVFFFFLFC